MSLLARKHTISRVENPLQTGGHSRQGDVPDLDIVVGPLVEQADLAVAVDNLLGKRSKGRDLDVPVVGHVDCVEGGLEWTGLSKGD